MRSIGVETQGLYLSFPARLLGLGAKKSAKQGGGSHGGGRAGAETLVRQVSEPPGLISTQERGTWGSFLCPTALPA